MWPKYVYVHMYVCACACVCVYVHYVQKYQVLYQQMLEQHETTVRELAKLHEAEKKWAKLSPNTCICNQQMLCRKIMKEHEEMLFKIETQHASKVKSFTYSTIAACTGWFAAWSGDHLITSAYINTYSNRNHHLYYCSL